MVRAVEVAVWGYEPTLVETLGNLLLLLEDFEWVKLVRLTRDVVSVLSSDAECVVSQAGQERWFRVADFWTKRLQAQTMVMVSVGDQGMLVP